MRILDRYVFMEWVKAFVMSLLAIMSLLIIEDIQDDLPDYLAWGATVGGILKYYLYLIPSFLPLILPIALLMSLLFALGNLHRRNEIIAMRASGLHLFRMTRSLVVAGCLLAALVLYLNASFVPYALEQSRTLRQNWRFDSLAQNQEKQNIGLIPVMTFDNRAQKRLWVMNRFSEYTLEGYGVTVYSLDDEHREVSRVMARRAYYDNVDNCWVMIEGRELTFNVQTGGAEREQRFDQRVYKDFHETPKLMQMVSKPPEDLSFLEIAALIEAIPPEDNPDMLGYLVSYQSILASPFICLIALAIGIPFSVAGVRTNPVVNIAKAAALFFVFFVVLSVFKMFGTHQMLPVALAVWLPNVGMCAFALWLWKRVA